MNDQRIEGAGQELKGGAKQVVGNVTGDDALQAEGATDRVIGSARQAVGSATDAVAPAVEKARGIAREKPWAVAALVGAIGVAVIGSIRGRSKSKT